MHRAIDEANHRTVIIETLDASRDMSAGDRERLLAVAFLVADVAHPAIARLYDITDVDGQAALVFESVDGETLEARMARGPVLAADALRIVTALAEGLAHAHANGLAHLDLTPANIRLDARSMPKILDLGIAPWTRGGAVRQAAAANPDAPGRTVGGNDRVPLTRTGAWRARRPPQRPLEPRRHLLRVAHAERACSRASARWTCWSASCSRPFRESSDLRPAVPSAYSDVIARCLSRGLETRYQSAAELLADLERLRTLPVSNDFAPAPMRLRIPHAIARRGMLAALVLTGLAIVAGWWMLSR